MKSNEVLKLINGEIARLRKGRRDVLEGNYDEVKAEFDIKIETLLWLKREVQNIQETKK